MPDEPDVPQPNAELPPLPPNLDPRRATRRSRHGGSDHDKRLRLKQISLYGTMALCTILSIALVVGTGIYWWHYRQFNNGIERINIEAANTLPNGKKSKDIDGKDENILIVGNDDRTDLSANELHQLSTTNDGGSLNTDTMMIIHVPADGKKATLISMPRDSYVDIPGHGMNKLNAAYPLAYNASGGSAKQKQAAGANLMIKTIQNLTALHIDHFAMVNLIGFYRISEALGGIKVKMCETVRDPSSGANFHKGVQKIKGATAVSFVRQRYEYPDGNGDIDRIARQQYFLTAAFRQVFSGNVLRKVNGLLGAVKSSVIVDGGLDPLSLGAQMQNLTANNISAQKSIPWDGFDDNTPVGSVVVVHPAEVQTFIRKVIGSTDPKLKTAKPVDPSTVTVNVLNAGSGVGGAAQTAADALGTWGVHVTKVGDSPDVVTATTIKYANGMQAQANTLAQFVSGAQLIEDKSVKTLTLLLGPDGVKAAAKPAAPTSTPTSGTPTTSAPSSSTPAPSKSATTKPKPIDASCIN